MSSIASNERGLFTESTVTSRDGTRIGYQSIGNGPSILVVHGALRDSNDYTRLARCLAHSFTVHIMDRRGRGRSGAQSPNYDITKECDDVQAIREATGANYLFGHSFGGLVSLEVARRDPTVTKLALYEPGVFIHPIDADWMSKYERALHENDFRTAFAHFARDMGGDTPLKRLPMWYAKFILKIVFRGERWEKLVRLMPQNLNEHREVYRLATTYLNYQRVHADTLLMSGEKSSDTTKKMMHIMNETIARSQSATLPRLNHFGPENDDAPEQVAKYLESFFLDAQVV